MPVRRVYNRLAESVSFQTLRTQLEQKQSNLRLRGLSGSLSAFAIAQATKSLTHPVLVICSDSDRAENLRDDLEKILDDERVGLFPGLDISPYDRRSPHLDVVGLRVEAMDLLTRDEPGVVVAPLEAFLFPTLSPEIFDLALRELKVHQEQAPQELADHLVECGYERVTTVEGVGQFSVRGGILDFCSFGNVHPVRLEFWGDEIERIVQVDPLTGEILGERDDIEIYPAKHFVTSEERLKTAIVSIETELQEELESLKAQDKLLEAQRLESRTNYDLEMLQETGYCSGVENYSRHLSGRTAGSTPYTLMDYFPEDYLLFIDESHMTLPQIRAMYGGDQSRKEVLVDYGFRLPSALDNRPLSFGEFEERARQVVYVSATPGPYEYEHSQQIMEQVIRPTGLSDPGIEVKPTTGQIDDLLYQIRVRTGRGERCLVTTLTKRMAEELADYLREAGIRTQHLHSEIDTLERSEVLRDLRLGVYEVVVGINLLREGLDLPEVSLVAILDADKEGYLRSTTSLTQTIGRAARHIDGQVIMYADRITDSMRRAIDETDRRRHLQEKYNAEHGITPQGIRKAVHDITERVMEIAETKTPYITSGDLPKEDILRLIKDLERQMKTASKNLEFEKAALLRDQITDLRKVMVEDIAG